MSGGRRTSQVSRRAFLGLAGVTTGFAAWPAGALARRGADGRPPGAPPGLLSERAPFERPVRRKGTSFRGAALTPLGALTGIVTPSDLHFTRHHAGIPVISPDRHELVLHGLVERPLVFRLEDLRRFPARSRIHFLECAGNGLAGFRDPRPDRSPADVDGATSTSEWTGVPLGLLLAEAGLRPGASWILAEGADACRYARSVPLADALARGLVAYAQNGESLRPEQGYPVRLVLAGWEGSTSVKWLRRLEVGDRPWMTREETARYTDVGPDGQIAPFRFELPVKSIITEPAYPQVIPRGALEIRGLAWSGAGRVAGVDVSVDGGRTWRPAVLDEPVLPFAHTRFRLPWRWSGEEATLVSRARDERGALQPTRAELLARRSAGIDYHLNNLRAWRVQRDGRVFFEAP